MNNQQKITINIIGGGNVAFHLLQRLTECEKSEVKQLYNRSGFSSDFQHFKGDKITDLALLKPCDICIIAVKDDAISEISSKIPLTANLVVHTSGNTEISAIDPKNRRGVFYPLQSFTKGQLIDFEQVPFCIEAENEEDLELLKILANIFSAKIYQIDSNQRKILHISAVFCNNFTNYLIGVGQGLCQKNHIPPEILQPLITQTFKKLEEISPFQAQTGPAKRGDFKTIQNHLALLDSNEKEIYKIITNSILSTYGKEKL